jgi:Fe-Mn family superoxide dismutase
MMTHLSRCPLPYPDTALAPVISANTVAYHYGKHHQAYVDAANRLLAGTEFAGTPVLEIVRAAWQAESTLIFNNVAQAWNHDFYWQSMRPGGGGAPSGRVADLVAAAFGSYAEFRAAFSAAAATQFGSGWVWLVLDGGELKVTKTSNAANPHCYGQTALLTIDVWEHAYYLDWQNRRADYVTAWLDKLLNWEFVERNLA